MPNSKAVFPKSGLALIALLVAASAALGVVHFVRSSAKRSVNSTATPVLTATQGRPHSNMEAELITVTPNGFEPLEINRPKGSFLLMVQNRSGLPDVASFVPVRVAAVRAWVSVAAVTLIARSLRVTNATLKPDWISRRLVTFPALRAASRVQTLCSDR
jgi:hypothetical protein